MKEYLDLEALRGGYEVVEENPEMARRPYKALAALVGCKEREIAITDSATTAWQRVFYGFDLRGLRLLTCKAEYGSNFIAYLQLSKRQGFHIDVVPDDDRGQMDLEALETELCKGDVGLVSVSHIPTSSGLVQPASEIGRLCSEHGVPFLLDACQTVGQMPVDVDELKCDFLTATGRKFLRGPRGTGFLFASEGSLERYPQFQEPGMLDNVGAQWTSPSSFALSPGAARFETFERNVAASIGLARAAEYALQTGPSSIWNRIQFLADTLRENINRHCPDVTLHDVGDRANLCGIVTFTKSGWSPDDLRQCLKDRHSIDLTVSRAPSTRLDFESRQLDAVVRASVHAYNLEEDVDKLLDALRYT